MLAVLIAGAIIASIVIAIDRSGPEGSSSEAGAEAEVNRLADIAIGEDEAPHSYSLPAGANPATALMRSIEGNVRRRIAQDKLAGPLQSVTCEPAGSASGGRAPYHCNVRSDDLNYLYLAVIDESKRQLTWCKTDPRSEDEGTEIPVSARCKA